MMVEWLFLMIPRVCLQFVIVVFPDHTPGSYSLTILKDESGLASIEHYLIRGSVTVAVCSMSIKQKPLLS